jgi:hypothetical protein
MQIWMRPRGRGRVTFCVVRGRHLTLQHDQPGVLRLTATHKGFTTEKTDIKKEAHDNVPIALNCSKGEISTAFAAKLPPPPRLKIPGRGRKRRALMVPRLPIGQLIRTSNYRLWERKPADDCRVTFLLERFGTKGNISMGFF